MTITASATNIYYPESDGTPVAETDDHRELMFELIFALQQRLGADAYVAGNLFLYYTQGDPTKVVSPDVFVVLGVPQRRHRTYKTWEYAGKAPDMVIELTSRGTSSEDLGSKRELYARLGVREYFIFDPLGEYLQPRLRAYELIDDELIPVGGQTVRSRVLGLELRPEGTQLRLYDIASGALLPTPAEEAAARKREAAFRRREAAARLAAETEVERLRAEIARLRGEAG